MHALQSRTEESTCTRLTIGTISLIRYVIKESILFQTLYEIELLNTDHNNKILNNKRHKIINLTKQPRKTDKTQSSAGNVTASDN
jgi:hypothetical protein